MPTQLKARSPYVVPEQHETPLPDAPTRLILSRFTGAVTADRIADVAAAGGPDAWFEQQLAPAAIADPAADALWSWFPTLALTPLQRWTRSEESAAGGRDMMQDLVSWIMLRRIVTRRQVEELMVDFWSNLLHVASPWTNVFTWRVEYAQTIRLHALGRFADLLQAAITHPAMGLYLGNTDSTGRVPDPRLGLEVLECYTVGVAAGYSTRDSLDSSKILTGYHVDTTGDWSSSYRPDDHWVGPVKVLDFTSANAKADGRPVVAKYLSYLAHHPATATQLCTRLAVRFVSDNPSTALVASLAKVYLDSDTDIVPVLRALLASDEFAASAMKKVRTPVDDTIASWTVNGSVITEPHKALDAAHQLIAVSNEMGQVLYDWPTADGFPDAAWAWARSGRMAGSFGGHWRAASGAFPNSGINYQAPIDWMPPLPTTFDNVVDYVVRRTLHVPCTPKMLRAACVATGIRPSDVITATGPLVTQKFPSLLVTVLDTPDHMTR